MRGKPQWTIAALGFVFTLCARDGSSEPRDDPWKEARPAQVARQNVAECDVLQRDVNGVRWLRVGCLWRLSMNDSQLLVAAGPIDDVRVELAYQMLRVTFPIREGEQRLMRGNGGLIISASWLKGDRKPTISIF